MLANEKHFFRHFALCLVPVFSDEALAVTSLVRFSRFFSRFSEMVSKVHVEGLDAFMAEVEKHSGKTVYALFCGTKDAEGKSWCPDCVTGMPWPSAYLYLS